MTNAGGTDSNRHNLTEPQRRTPPTRPDCQEIASLIPAYGLGALDPDEEVMVKAALTCCPEEAEALAEYTELAQAMLYSAPPAQAPIYLAERLQAAIAGDTPAAPAGEQTVGAASGQTRSTLGRHPGRWRFSQIAAAAALLLLLISNGYWLVRFDQLRAAQQDMAERLERQHIAMDLAWNDGTHWARLPAAQENSPARAVVIWQTQQKTAVLYVEDFPPLPPEQVYQVWLIQGDQRTSAGLFTVDAAGESLLIFETESALDAFDAMGITPEPAGGSPGPTASPVERGGLSS
jgi:anti-sigma factor RsiW